MMGKDERYTAERVEQLEAQVQQLSEENRRLTRRVAELEGILSMKDSLPETHTSASKAASADTPQESETMKRRMARLSFHRAVRPSVERDLNTTHLSSPRTRHPPTPYLKSPAREGGMEESDQGEAVQEQGKSEPTPNETGEPLFRPRHGETGEFKPHKPNASGSDRAEEPTRNRFSSHRAGRGENFLSCTSYSPTCFERLIGLPFEFVQLIRGHFLPADLLMLLYLLIPLQAIRRLLHSHLLNPNLPP